MGTTIADKLTWRIAVVSPNSRERAAGESRSGEEDLAKVRESRRRLAIGADEDRRDIERALHDGLQQQLTAVAMQVERARLLIGSDPAAAAVALQEASAVVRQAVAEAAALAQRIYPAMLEAGGLSASVRSAARVAGRGVSVDASSLEGLSAHIAAALYWTCLDAIGAADPDAHIQLRVSELDGGVEFEIAGPGHYTARQVERLRDRIEAVGGRLNVVAKKSARLTGWLPLR